MATGRVSTQLKNALERIPEKVLEIEPDSFDDKVRNSLFGNVLRGVQILYWLSMFTILIASVNIVLFANKLQKRIQFCATEAMVMKFPDRFYWCGYIYYLHFL